MNAPRRIDGPCKLVELGSRAGWLFPGQHALELDEEFVAALLHDQCPQWARRPLQRVVGWDNTTFRLGTDLGVRLPRGDWAATQPPKEYQVLQMLAEHVAMPIPTPIFLGAPALGYPWQWTVYRWVEGEVARPRVIGDQVAFAAGLARFLRELHDVPEVDLTAPATCGHGGPLAPKDVAIRAEVLALADVIDSAAVLAIWEEALAAEPADRTTWLHGDINFSNLLVRNGRLAGVIDFGCVAYGDRAVDLMGAWDMFDAAGRAVFRDHLEVDDRTWARARGWALAYALPTPEQLVDPDPTVATYASEAMRRLGQVLLG